MTYKIKLNWKVSTVRTEDLEKTLNTFEQEGFEIDNVEKCTEVYNPDYAGLMWVVVGWQPEGGWGLPA